MTLGGQFDHQRPPPPPLPPCTSTSVHYPACLSVLFFLIPDQCVGSQGLALVTGVQLGEGFTHREDSKELIYFQEHMLTFFFYISFFFRDFALIIVNVFFPCMVHYIVLKASVSNVWVSALLWHLGLLYTSCFKFTFAQLPICSYPLG